MSEYSFLGFEEESIYKDKETSRTSQYSFSGFEDNSMDTSRETTGSEYSFSGFGSDSETYERRNKIMLERWKTSKKWKIATWNVRTLYQAGKKSM